MGETAHRERVGCGQITGGHAARPERLAAPPAPCPLPFLVTLVVRIHLGRPLQSWLSGAPIPTPTEWEAGRGSRPRSRLSWGCGRGWAFCGSCSLGPSTQRLPFPAQTLLNTCPLFTLKKAFGSPPSKARASAGGGAEALWPQSWEPVLWPQPVRQRSPGSIQQNTEG